MPPWGGELLVWWSLFAVSGFSSGSSYRGLFFKLLNMMAAVVSQITTISTLIIDSIIYVYKYKFVNVYNKSVERRFKKVLQLFKRNVQMSRWQGGRDCSIEKSHSEVKQSLIERETHDCDAWLVRKHEHFSVFGYKWEGKMISCIFTNFRQIREHRTCHLIDARNHGDSEDHHKMDYLVSFKHLNSLWGKRAWQWTWGGTWVSITLKDAKWHYLDRVWVGR